MRLHLIFTLLFFNSRDFAPHTNAQEHYGATVYPFELDESDDFIFEEYDDELEEHVRVPRDASDEGNLGIGPAGALQDGTSAEGSLEAGPPGADQDWSSTEGSLESGPPGADQDWSSTEGSLEADSSGAVQDGSSTEGAAYDLFSSLVYESASAGQDGSKAYGDGNDGFDGPPVEELQLLSLTTNTISCLREMAEILKEIKTELLVELKANRKAQCKHRNVAPQDSLNCICGFFDASNNLKVQLSYSNISGVSKSDHEENACIESCVSLVLKRRSFVLDLICNDVDYLNKTKVHLYTSPDPDSEEFEWKYSGYAIPAPLCCHEKRKVDCSRLEEGETVV